MKPVFEYTQGMTRASAHYCPGCTHGIAHRIIMEVLDEMGMLGKAIGVAPIGCSVMAHQYMNVDMCEAAHGRAPAVAGGIRRVHPDKIVFTYQGDGDLASIGTAEIVHAAVRGEKFTTFFINNGIYGMTGGQMAPTTLIGQKSTTSQDGRSKEVNGMPLKMSEMIATIDGAVYVERVSLVEVVSSCPTNWGMTPQKALEWIDEKMIPYYPLGVYKDRSAAKEEK